MPASKGEAGNEGCIPSLRSMPGNAAQNKCNGVEAADRLQSVADEAGGTKRFATPEEMANFFVFLCSDKASYSTGSTYFVDGGWLRTVQAY
jgi:NAD(P)-dependent dehydrogenase (short-subunit alcohol dehydrogenase family)